MVNHLQKIRNLYQQPGKDFLDYKNIIEKFICDIDINEEEKEYILSFSLVFLSMFDEKDHETIHYFEYAYYLILKYAIKYEDYEPLYHFAYNSGFYPIFRYLLDSELINMKKIKISDVLLNTSLINYKKGESGKEFIQTREQKKTSRSLLGSIDNHITYLAPTSYGKSELILEHFSKNKDRFSKFVIVVPTKTLLSEFSRKLRSYLKYKMIHEYSLITHDDMYNNDEKIICVMTQERALRMIDDKNIFFDVLYIDEAHNLYKKDSRNILLSRLIRRNYSKNKSQKTLFLSPLIADSNNLMPLAVDNENKLFEANIKTEKISFNMKEPEFYLYQDSSTLQTRKDKDLEDSVQYKYNRFISDKIEISRDYDDYLDYIEKNSKNKNLIYFYSPKSIELFADDLYNKLPNIEVTEEVEEIQKLLEKHVNVDYYERKYLEKGILYLHGKIPSNIRSYLEYKFSHSTSIKYLIANMVVMEGVNIPFDTMFILDMFSMKKTEFYNLIGRVNRLDKVFSKEGGIHKLLPKVHILNTNWTNVSNIYDRLSKYCNTSGIKDEVENPTLLNKEEEIEESKKKEIEKIKESESDYLNKIDLLDLSSEDKLKNLMYQETLTYKSGRIEAFIDISNEEVLHKIIENISTIDKNDISVNNLIDYIYYIFLQGISDKYTKNQEFNRLKIPEIRDFYKTYKNMPLNQAVIFQLNYFKYVKDQIESGKWDELRKYIYLSSFGREYGYFYNDNKQIVRTFKKNYINVKENYSKGELINYAIIKVKLEEDFISNILKRFVKIMLKLELIDERLYNEFVYGTNNYYDLKMIKLGMSKSIIDFLKSKDQIKNLYFETSYIKGTDEFKDFYNSLYDDLLKFEINSSIEL
jgi:hypothetical protein